MLAVELLGSRKEAVLAALGERDGQNAANRNRLWRTVAVTFALARHQIGA
jgi:hypothetical protein